MSLGRPSQENYWRSWDKVVRLYESLKAVNQINNYIKKTLAQDKFLPSTSACHFFEMHNLT